MTPAEINKTAPPIYYIGGAVVIDKIISKTNHMQISFLVSSCFSFCFPAAYTQLETPSEVAIAVRMLIAI